MDIHCFVPRGFDGHLVTVEVDIRRGIPGTDIVGLPGGAVREARERVRTATRNVGLVYPQDRVIINLVPAGVPKVGASFDLAIALAVLHASGQLPSRGYPAILALGELQLNGSLRPVSGVLAAIVAAREAGIRHVILPHANVAEASIISGLVIRGAGTLEEAVAAVDPSAPPAGATEIDHDDSTVEAPSFGNSDFREMRGHPLVKRVSEIAAAGGHSLLLVGAPGVGKSLALSCYPSILPDLQGDRAVEATRIHSLAGTLKANGGLMRRPPVRRPHQSATLEGLIGGGSMVLPGEASLAHGGVLCLDEALEFAPRALQSLRQPLQDGSVCIVRAGEQYWFPADFQLLLATNPCPCGYRDSATTRCLCSELEISRYWKRLGGALLDRIELRLAIPPISGDILSDETTECSADLRGRVREARAAQRSRFGEGLLNATAAYGALRERAALEPEAESLLRSGASHLRLSNRGLIQALRVARTIADIEQSREVRDLHVSEALQYRRYAAQWE